MIQIDKTYDVILTHSPIYEITGHIFECFDYYLFLRQFYKVGIISTHGNSEEMSYEENKPKRINTTNRVPFLITDTRGQPV